MFLSPEPNSVKKRSEGESKWLPILAQEAFQLVMRKSTRIGEKKATQFFNFKNMFYLNPSYNR